MCSSVATNRRVLPKSPNSSRTVSSGRGSSPPPGPATVSGRAGVYHGNGRTVEVDGAQVAKPAGDGQSQQFGGAVLSQRVVQ